MHLLTASILRQLDSSGFGTDKGRLGYDPADLPKPYIYGYLHRIRSSRRLEVETHRNLEVIWLLRQLKPDFKTIADFRRDNRGAFRAVFRQFVRLCRELDLYGRELIAVDRRRESVEYPFGSIKQWMGQCGFLTRRLDNVRGEFSLTPLAYNMRRAINLVGIPALIAVAAR